MRSREVRKVSDGTDLKRLRQFMLGQPQFYPRHAEWIDGKCLPRIESGQAEGWIVIQDGVIVGDAVYQKLPGEPGRVELKNLRTDPHYRDLDIGRSLLQVVQTEAATMVNAGVGELTIVTDVSTPNFSGVEFFVRNGFQIVGMEEIYVPGQAEYLLQKVA